MILRFCQQTVDENWGKTMGPKDYSHFPAQDYDYVIFHNYSVATFAHRNYKDSLDYFGVNIWSDYLKDRLVKLLDFPSRIEAFQAGISWLEEHDLEIFLKSQ